MKLLAIRHRDDVVAELQNLAQVLLDRASPSDWQLGTLRSIDAVHRHCGRKVSPVTRSQRRQVLTLAGMPLSTLACLLRFQHTMRLIELRRLPLATVALEAGYADQPHLNRDFRRFGAGTPGVPDASAPPTWRH